MAKLRAVEIIRLKRAEEDLVMSYFNWNIAGYIELLKNTASLLRQTLKRG